MPGRAMGTFCKEPHPSQRVVVDARGMGKDAMLSCEQPLHQETFQWMPGHSHEAAAAMGVH